MQINLFNKRICHVELTLMIHYTWFVSFFFSQRKVMLIKSIRDLFIYTDEENMQKNREKRNKKRFFFSNNRWGKSHKKSDPSVVTIASQKTKNRKGIDRPPRKINRTSSVMYVFLFLFLISKQRPIEVTVIREKKHTRFMLSISNEKKNILSTEFFFLLI